MNLELLKKMIAIESIYPNEYNFSLFLEQELISLGFEIEKQYISENRFNIFAKRGIPTDSAVCLFGHMDTVPVYGDWSTDPFKAEQIDDKLYGLGAVDMKGGLFAILEACRKTDSNKYLKVLFCVDEENISEGAWTAVQNEDYFNDVKLIVAAETGNIHPYDPNEKWVHLGRRGRCSVQIEVKGLSAHGAFPEKGINAIFEASKLVTALEDLKIYQHPIIGKSSNYVSNFTSNNTSLSIPDYCKFEVNMSLVPPQTPESSLNEIKELINKYVNENNIKSEVSVSLVKRNTPFAPPYVTDLENPSVQKCLQIISEDGTKASVDYGLSVADENVFANKTKAAVISIGPEGDNEHTANEWVNIASLERLINYFIKIIQEV